MNHQPLLLVWIVFTALALVGVSAVFVWAVRTRQFGDQDRARFLPLRSGIPEKNGVRPLFPKNGV